MQEVIEKVKFVEAQQVQVNNPDGTYVGITEVVNGDAPLHVTVDNTPSEAATSIQIQWPIG